MQFNTGKKLIMIGMSVLLLISICFIPAQAFSEQFTEEDNYYSNPNDINVDTNLVDDDGKLINDMSLDKLKNLKKPVVFANSAVANPGGEVSVKLTMSTLVRIAGINVKLSYDPGKMTVENVKLAAQLGFNAVNTSVPGEIILSGVNADGITLPHLDIATIKFGVKPGASGIVPVKLVNAEACNAAAQTISLIKLNGYVVITPSPVATHVSFKGETVTGKTLTAAYDYYDPGFRPEAGTTFRWLAAEHGSSDFSAINGAVDRTFTVTKDLIGKDIKVEVTPRNKRAAGAPATGDNGRSLVIRLGDANQDGMVNFVDALKSLQYITNKAIPDSKALAAADIDNNGRVDVTDVVQILKIDIGLVMLN